ncbi:MAG: hypothetical protein WBE48_04160 [Xanthobacteraceae bacterium]|jgi:hypothetical protein
MSDTPTNPSTAPAWSAWPFWPSWILGSPAATRSVDLSQPINPGWTFGNVVSVTEQNSSSPDTERDIVAAESYGRQIGRVMDALTELVSELPQSTQQKPVFKDLIALSDKIEKIKRQSATRRLDRIAADLAVLRTGDVSEYRRVVQELRVALAADEQPSR